MTASAAPLPDDDPLRRYADLGRRHVDRIARIAQRCLEAETEASRRHEARVGGCAQCGSDDPACTGNVTARGLHCAACQQLSAGASVLSAQEDDGSGPWRAEVNGRPADVVALARMRCACGVHFEVAEVATSDEEVEAEEREHRLASARGK